MAIIWLALAVSLLAVVVATTMAVRRALDLFRASRRLSRGVGGELAAIEQATAQIEGHLAAAARSQASLERSTARLRRSRAELNVLLSALADARASLDRVTAFWPAK